MNLQELTGYESGAVIFKESNEGFITNWSSIEGIPRQFSWTSIGLGDGEDLEMVNNSEYEEFALELAEIESQKCLAEGQTLCVDENIIAGIWENEEVVIITFQGWN